MMAKMKNLLKIISGLFGPDINVHQVLVDKQRERETEERETEERERETKKEEYSYFVSRRLSGYCPDCDGRGGYGWGSPRYCDTCNGTGVGGTPIEQHQHYKWLETHGVYPSVEKINEEIKKLLTKGGVSDGYHTFDELYFHRMFLFSIVISNYRESAWKSLAHADGTMDVGYFIVGVTTPMGDFTYHYKLEHWEMFKCKEIKKSPEWDGHTSKDISRLNSLDTLDYNI